MFHDCFKYIVNQYGLSIFKGNKSLFILNDLHAFENCPAMKVIYRTFLDFGGNVFISSFASSAINNRVFNQHKEQFIKDTHFRRDMVTYLYQSLYSIWNRTAIIQETHFQNPFDPYYQDYISTRKKGRLLYRLIYGFCFIVLICFSLYTWFCESSKTSTPLVHTEKEIIQEESSNSFQMKQPSSDVGIDKKAVYTYDNKNVEDTHLPKITTPSGPSNVQFDEVTETNIIDIESNTVSSIEGNTRKVEVVDRNEQIDESEYLLASKRYLLDPATHHLAEKYAKLAYDKGQLEALEIINELKLLGYYE